MIKALEQIKEILTNRDYLTSVEIEKILDDPNLTKEDKSEIQRFIIENRIDIVEDENEKEQPVPEDIVDDDDVVNPIAEEDIEAQGQEVAINKNDDPMYEYITKFLETNNIKLDDEIIDEFVKEISAYTDEEYTYENIVDFLETKGLNNNIDQDSIINLAKKIKRENARRFEVGKYVNDSVRMYLAEIGRIPLYTFEEEQEAAYKIKEQRELVEKLQAANSEQIEEEQAKLKELEKEFATHNLRLVVSIARRYCTSSDNLLDLIQEGNLGLQKAVEKFEVEKGFKFSTYATWWITQAITRSIADTSRTIRIPVHLHEQISKLKKADRVLTATLGRTPTIDELAKEINATPEKVEELRKLLKGVVSLDSPIKTSDGDQDSLIVDFVKDEKANPEEETMARELQKEVSQLLKHMKNPRSRRVIIYRFGLYDNNISEEEMEATRLRYLIATLPVEKMRSVPESVMEDLIRNMTSRKADNIKNFIIKKLPEDIKNEGIRCILPEHFNKLSNIQKRSIYVSLFGESSIPENTRLEVVDFRIKTFFEQTDIDTLRSLCKERLSNEEKGILLSGMSSIEKEELIDNVDENVFTTGKIQFAKRIIDVLAGKYTAYPLKDYAPNEADKERKIMINIINNDPYKDMLKDKEEYATACLVAKEYRDIYGKDVFPSTLIYVKSKFREEYNVALQKFQQGSVATLEDIGQLEDLTRERIRQIEAKAKRELFVKQRGRIHSLKGYLNN